MNGILKENQNHSTTTIMFATFLRMFALSLIVNAINIKIWKIYWLEYLYIVDSIRTFYSFECEKSDFLSYEK